MVMELENMSKEQLIAMVMELMKDRLTGCYRREIISDIDMSYYVVALIDINGLKQINDTLGHNAGDDYIVSVAKDIKSNIRSTDTLIRYGGDEFVVIFKDCTVEQARIAVDRIKNTSSGVGEAKFFEQALHLADLDMYNHKREYYSNLIRGKAVE